VGHVLYTNEDLDDGWYQEEFEKFYLVPRGCTALEQKRTKAKEATGFPVT